MKFSDRRYKPVLEPALEGMQCIACTMLIGEDHVNKKPYYIRYNGKDHTLCGDCYRRFKNNKEALKRIKY